MQHRPCLLGIMDSIPYDKEMQNTSYLELSQSALNNNIQFIRKNITENRILSCVVKGNAYGHGIDKFVPMLLKAGVKHISVFSSFEAHQVKLATGKKNVTIMIMGDISEEDFEWVIKSKIEFFVFDIYRLKRAIELAKKLKMKALVHLEVETGMHRLGLEKEELPIALELLKENKKYIQFKGICTHYAGAESVANHIRVKDQIKRFNRALTFFKKNNFEPDLVHAACSAASLRFPKTRGDLVRIGILQYGFWPSEETFITYCNKRNDYSNPLSPVISWKSRVMSLKRVKVGEFIGYGNSYMANENKKLAVIPLGYTNGFARSLSNSGRVIINDFRTQVVGTVNMNAITVDVTALDNIAIGDEVILIGKSDSAEVTVSSFANFTDQLNYEVLARLPKDIERRVV